MGNPAYRRSGVSYFAQSLDDMGVRSQQYR
jgi:hypothetical protein